MSNYIGNLYSNSNYGVDCSAQYCAAQVCLADMCNADICAIEACVTNIYPGGL